MVTTTAIHLVNEAFSANANREFSRASKLAEKACKLDPGLAEAWYNLGVAQKGLGKIKPACRALQKAASLTRASVDAQSTIGLELSELGAIGEARSCFYQALNVQSDFLPALLNLGRLEAREGNYAAAEALFRKAIELEPQLASAFTNLAATLNAQKRFDEALDACQTSITLDAGSADAFSNLGVTLLGLRRFADAEAACHRAIQLAPDHPKALANLSTALLQLKKIVQAQQVLKHALTLQPRDVEALINLAWAHAERKAYPEAIAYYNAALQIDPNRDYLLGTYLDCCMKICQWDSLSSMLPRIERDILEGKKVVRPFEILSISKNPLVHKACAETWVNNECPENSTLGAISKLRGKSEKLRIGYFSADFHNHATAFLISELFELHDKNKFELVAFSFGPNVEDQMRQRIVNAFDEFLDVQQMSDKEIARLSREKQIDIAVDLKGYTQDGREGIFSFRAAPLQISYLGFPGTLGSSYMDYIIADQTLIPEGAQQFYSEKIIYLPDSYQVNDTKRIISDTSFSRQGQGLPESGFVFCCFNNNYKITPDVFDSWMRILSRVENSTLWLIRSTEVGAANLRNAAQARGIAPDRLVFAQPIPLPEHLARLQLADLFIDSWPYNAHTTCSDALWAGLPVLTYCGASFASRVGASLLSAVGMQELITHTVQDFEDLAVALASNSNRLAMLREKLYVNRNKCALFDTERFTRNLEAAYIKAHTRYNAGMTPGHISI